MILKTGRFTFKLTISYVSFLLIIKYVLSEVYNCIIDKVHFLVLQIMDACCKLGMFIFYLMDGLLLIQLVEGDLEFYGEG